MAILIPSKNIYDKQNPKVRDNVIERIEVGAVEVVPDNEYETPVYNKSFNNFINGERKKKSSEILSTPLGGYYTLYTVYSGLKLTYCDFSVLIKKLQNNKFISTLLLGAKIDEVGNETNNITYTIYGKKRIGKILATYYVDLSTIQSKIVGYYTIGTPTITNEEQLSISSNYQTDEIKSLFSTTLTTKHPDITHTATITVVNEQTNFKTVKAKDYEENNVEYYKLLNNDGNETLKILVGVEKISAWGDGKISYSNPTESNDYIEQKSNYIQYLPEKIEITIYGNTIGVDLVDKTVYINGETAKKVHSVDGNELMQTSNIFYEKGNDLVKDTDYEIFETEIAGGDLISCNISLKTAYETPVIVSYLDEYEETRIKIIEIGETNAYITYDARGSITILSVYETQSKNQLYSQFDKTKKLYSKGKETATIRCSISDYYDYDSGDKVISIDNSVDKMSFKMYDQVIPMVYGADRKDRPMSTYQDGTPKVFQVLGTNIYYDGAVWQELSLQEVDKNKII